MEQSAAKRELFSSQGFDTKPAIVSVVVCLPQCRGSRGTHRVTTLRRNVLKFCMHHNQRRDRKTTLSAVIPHIVQNNRGLRFFLSRLGSWLKSVILHVLLFIY